LENPFAVCLEMSFPVVHRDKAPVLQSALPMMKILKNSGSKSCKIMQAHY